MEKISLIIILFAISFIAKCQFKGGGGDGYTNSTIYTQPYTSVFVGGPADGFATAFYNQVSTPLPIKIIYFNAKKVGDFAKLEWKTSSEINASHFEIERSIDAIKFEKISEINAYMAENYMFHDNLSQITKSTSLVYYRLKLVDLDGKFKYSPTRIVSFDLKEINEIKAFPNPTSGIFEIEIPQNILNEIITISVYNSIGQVLQLFEKQPINQKMVLDLSALPKEIYYVHLQNQKLNASIKILLK